jgi:hypothetical protein
MNHYLVGPAIAPALASALLPHREAARCLTFGPPGSRVLLVSVAGDTVRLGEERPEPVAVFGEDERMK